jgi:UDP-N-acetylmuramate dehydrogenase
LNDGQVKLAAGWLIDQAGWKGARQGPAAVHDRQALVLTNPGHGDGRDVLALAQAIAADVYARYGVQLEMEPRVYV